MALPAVDRLLAANHGGTTVLHTRPHLARLLGSLFPAATVVASERRASPFATARRLLIETGRAELGLTLRNAWRAKITLRLAARARWGSGGQGGALLLSRRHRLDRSRHQIHDVDPVLGHLGLEPVSRPWSCTLPAALLEEGLASLRGARVAELGRAVGLAPGSAGAAHKRWPTERFSELARGLKEQGWHPVVLIGPGEQVLAEEITGRTPGLRVVGHDLDVAGLAGVVAALDRVVGIDSGPVHVASAVGTPVIALFGPTSPERTAPVGPGACIVTAPSMAGISVRAVADAVSGTV